MRACRVCVGGGVGVGGEAARLAPRLRLFTSNISTPAPSLRRYAKNFTQCGSKVIAAPTAASALTLTGLRAGAVTAAVFFNTTTGAQLPLAAGGSATVTSGTLIIVFPDFWEDAAAYITMS